VVKTLAVAAILFGAAATAHAQLSTRVHASGFNSPVAFVQDPVFTNVQYVVEQDGRIRVVRDGTVLATDFLDLRAPVLSGGERGLLGMAFAPADSNRFYVNFTNNQGHTVVARFRRSGGDPLVADPESRFDLRWGGAGAPAVIEQPFSNHNGGHLAFGPDGYLYIGLGDGGDGNDPGHRAQSPSTLLGKMLRVDVNVPDSDPLGYFVPPDNPFLDGSPIAARGEIWSFGLRNPWRYTFDDPARGGTGALIIADVGQGAREEIDYEPPARGGRNYGWRNKEGTLNNVTSLPPAYQPLVDPIHEYDRTVGASITGGYVYRGRSLGAAFRGRYFFADFVRSRVWSMSFIVESNGEARSTGVTEHTSELGGSATLAGVSSFGVDADGELYIVSHSRGVILRVLGGSSTPPVPTGLRIIR
jgi:glucose/arabinose dehydrogenase